MICSHCNQDKHWRNFGVDRTRSAGRKRVCKLCRLHHNRTAGLEARREANHRYRHSTKGLANAWAYKRRQQVRMKKRAHMTVREAIKDGRLKRQPCETCGASPAQAHHDDYKKRLEVRWLCRNCHAEHHRLEKKHARR